MNKDKVKTMLRVCIDPMCDRDDCNKQCEYHDYVCCQDYLCRDALAVIEEQEKDYSKLQEEFANYQLASDKEIRAQVKQAKIEVLNEVTIKAISLSAIETYRLSKVVDELTKEIENDER